MAGELRIGSNNAIGGGFLPAVLDPLSSQRPRIAFRVKLGDEVMLHYHDLRERNVDLLLGRVLEPTDDMDIEVLFEELLYVVAGGQQSMDTPPQGRVERARPGALGDAPT